MVSPASSSRAVDFSDGSRIELRAGARVEPIENSSRAFRVALAAGAATFDVRPGGPRRWAVECGRVSVEVVGTRFTVACAPAAVRVDVERGIVLVRGDGVPDGAKRLTAGMSLEVQDTPPVEIRPTLPDPEDAQPPLPRLAPTRVPAPAGPPSALPTPSAPWKSLALHGDNDSAYAELGPQGIASASETASVEDLLTLADVARLSGHPRDAVAPLSRIVSEHAQDPSAPLAAFTLGRIQLDSLAQPREAATSFQRAIDLGLPRSLEQDAYARRVEAKARAGDAAGAREARQEYERRFPQGQRLNEVRKWSHAD
jgi:transmembrane sensor